LTHFCPIFSTTVFKLYSHLHDLDNDPLSEQLRHQSIGGEKMFL